jgi:hypothetical protein
VPKIRPRMSWWLDPFRAGVSRRKFRYV